MCEFLRSSVHPSIEDVLARVGESSVCTSTRCFESGADAFGLLPSATHQTTSHVEFIAAAFAAIAILCRVIQSVRTSSKSAVKD